MPFYGGGGGESTPTYKPTPFVGLGGGGGDIDVQTDDLDDIGKGSIDLTDPVGSIGETLGNFGGGIAGAAGGLLGAIGSIGPDGDTASLGQLAEDIGRIPGGVGDFQLPYLGNDPNRQGAKLSQVPGAIYEPIYQTLQTLQRESSRARIAGTGYGPGTFEKDENGILRFRPGEQEPLPPDLQSRLDAGAPVEEIVEELLARGQGFSSRAGAQFATEALVDPLNLIAPGASKALGAVKNAGYAVKAADDLGKLGLGQRSIGTIYNAATAGMGRAGGAVMDRVIGPVTSGVFHALGTKPYNHLLSAANSLDRAYGEAFGRAFDLGAAQMPRAVIAREIAQDIGSRLSTKVDDVERLVRDRLGAKMRVANDELERRTEELLSRVTPVFSVIDDAVTDSTVRKYAAITGMSPEDAARAVGKVDRGVARTVHLAYYGHAGGELAELKRVLPSTKKLDVERLTVIAPDTLTDELADLVKNGDIAAAEAVDRFSVLSNHFAGKVPSDGDVFAFIDEIRDSLPQVVRLPKTGKNRLPKELGDWRARNADFGYELGFAPKDGWKVKIAEDGTVTSSDPFVHFTSDVDPVTQRNPLGKMLDGLFRGVNQTVIVQESRERMTDIIARAELPISPNQVRNIHKAIIEEAATRKLSPRALISLDEARRPVPGRQSGGENVFRAIFRKFLSVDEYEKLTGKFDPTYIVLKAFEGNLETVGLTQKITGKLKAAPVGGQIITRITEHMYPLARFKYRPTFQAQEAIESPVLNALRGVTDRAVPDELIPVYRALAEQPEYHFLTEANLLNITGEREVVRFMGTNSPVGRAMGRFGNISGSKEVARARQVMFEHGEDFERAVKSINPKFWKAMEEAYGTSDPKVIADRFLAERHALGAGENLDEAMKLVDEAKAEFDDVVGHMQGTLADAVIRPGMEAASQADNIAAAALKGGTAESGGAIRGSSTALPSSASEQVWQAFRESMRQASNRAFQTHFFNPQRGWLERSLNHPYLALYPLSYMWGKVLPEFARFLIVRPFGKNVPLVPLANLERVQQAYLGALADDPEFAAFIEDHEESVYFANLLFPGNPVNMTVNFPAPVRHIAEVATANARGANRKLDPERIAEEATNAGNYSLNPARDLQQFAEVGQDLSSIFEDVFSNLDKAAAQYDGQFGFAPTK